MQKPHPFRGQAVDVRRLVQVGPLAGDVGPAQVVGQDQDHVHRLRLRLHRRARRHRREQEQKDSPSEVV